MGAAVTEFDFGAHGGEQSARGFNVSNLGDVFQDDFAFREQSRGHARQGSILGSTDADRAEEWGAAADY
jgi:hypothetical protein